MKFLRTVFFRWHVARHALHTQRLIATIAGLPKTPDGKLTDPSHVQRLGNALYLGQQLADKATTVGAVPTPPAAPTPHPFPAPSAAPNWLGWIQTGLLVGVLAFVAPTKFSGCTLPWPPRPTPPGPPPVPVPTNPLTQALQGAYAAETAPDKATSLLLLQQVWEQAATIAANDATFKTVGDLAAVLHTAAQAVLGDRLAGMRKVIETEANKALPTNPAAPLDAPTRIICQREFSIIASALKEVK